MKNEEFLKNFKFIPCQDKYEGMLSENDKILGDCQPESGSREGTFKGLGDCEAWSH